MNRQDAFYSVLAGGVAGSLSRAFVMPFDVVKIRLQLQTEGYALNAGGKYHGALHCARTVIREEGLRALWKGHVPSQLLSITYGMAQFPVFEATTHILQAHFKSQYEIMQAFIAGSVSAAVATCATYPFDTIRTRMIGQGEPKVYTGFLHACTSMYKSEGAAVFYQGIRATLAGVMPYIGTSFATYVGAKRMLEPLQHSLPPQYKAYAAAGNKVVAGAMAGLVSKVIVHPFDVIKKREQVVGFSGPRLLFSRVGTGGTYGSTWNAMVTILHTEGVRGLFKGVTPTIAKSVPSSILVFLVYDSLRLWLLKEEL